MVFLDFFYALREAGLKSTFQEWRMLLHCLEQGLHDSRLDGFYHVARACLVKSESDFDTFDMVFARYFEGIEGNIELAGDTKNLTTNLLAGANAALDDTWRRG